MMAETFQRLPLRTFALLALLAGISGGSNADDANLFRKQIATILEKRCLSCHNESSRKGGLSLATSADATTGGDSGPAVVAAKSAESLLLDMISGDTPEMPKNAPPLSKDEVALLKKWIEQGAKWPNDLTLKDRRFEGEAWWSLQPLARPPVPKVKAAAWVRTPIDGFILSKLEEQGLAPNPQADRRTLIRRLSYDLCGLPPTPEEIDAFVNDKSPDAYERLVDRLLASPRYGERWARHWLDVVHYGDTHGYDKDKLRPNAWPYRDYVIRSFNDDKPYTTFIQEQIAGDVFYPGSGDGIVALGFLAAGPWDYVGQVELREGSLDKQITRNLDRDDMVATTMNTFASLTVQCARCHDHKFDPIGQEDYYSLQAVFAAVDRAERPFDPDSAKARKRLQLERRREELAATKLSLDAKLKTLAGPELVAIDKRLVELKAGAKGGERPEFGYHSQIERDQNVAKWVQVDLGQPTPIESVSYVGCHDTFNSIGAGFGFPVRFKIEISDDPQFGSAQTIVDQANTDAPNPGVAPQSAILAGKSARFVRFTATKLAPRANDYIFALAELAVWTPDGKNAARVAAVTALDSIEAAPRWRKTNLVDGYYYGVGKSGDPMELERLTRQRAELLEKVADAGLKQELARVDRELKDSTSQLAALGPQAMVYAAATQFASQGSFKPTEGTPRPIHLLHRGSEKNPGKEVDPGTVACLAGLESRFSLSDGHAEGERRAALARWIVDKRNPLTWRSIVNRVWLYHFGRGIVETPNDFGRMGATPTHPELLDWLAVEFRDGEQSIKQLTRLIVTSSTYRQSTANNAAGSRVDAGNRWLWRMNRRKLEAEAIRDAVLSVSGKLDLTMYGPGFRPFGFTDDHSPHYKYEEYDPNEPAAHRRSVYRFLVRSVPDPFMETLDCADPSLIVERRNETLTALQALALLNNKFMVAMAEHFAARVQAMAADLPQQIVAAFRLAVGRSPTQEELQVTVELARKHGLPSACRMILNTNEFCFVD